MELITKQWKTNEVAKEWKNRYYSTYTGEWRYGSDKEEIYNKLVALGFNPNPDEVNEIIGNNGWTEVKCQVCGSQVEAVMKFEKMDDYNYMSINICKSCIEKAMNRLGRF